MISRHVLHATAHVVLRVAQHHAIAQRGRRLFDEASLEIERHDRRPIAHADFPVGPPLDVQRATQASSTAPCPVHGADTPGRRLRPGSRGPRRSPLVSCLRSALHNDDIRLGMSAQIEFGLGAVVDRTRIVSRRKEREGALLGCSSFEMTSLD
jgi:hypothetical protein